MSDHSNSGAAPRVVVLDDGYDGVELEADVLAHVGAQVDLRPCMGDPGRVLRAVAGASAVLVRESPVTAEAIHAMPECRAIVRYGVGVDNIDLEAARGAGIVVANVPDYGTEDVSTHALALMLAVSRRLVSRDAAVRRGAWNIARAERMFRFNGQTLGLVGCGRIGRLFAQKAQALGFARVLVHDPFLTDLPAGWQQANIATLCGAADVISLHAPLTAQTRHIIGAAEIAAMKPEAMLINTSRGALIDTVALAAALARGHLLGAGLDVFEHEPLPPDHPILSAPRAVLSDHVGWYSEESVADLRRKAAEEVARILTGQPPRNRINPPDRAAS